METVVSIVIGSYNRRHFLSKTIDSIRHNGITVPYETIVVDGGSTDGTIDYLKKQKDVITIIQHNRGTFRGQPIKRRGWGYFMNLGFKCAQGKFVIMISDDCLLVPGAIMNGIKHFDALTNQGRKIGAVAFYWRNWPQQQDYWVGLTLGDKIFVNHGMYLRQALEEIGWIDEERYQFYHADGDLCLKLWNHGYEVVDCPNAFVEHFQHANAKVRESNLRQQKADWAAYLDRWTGIFYDPAKDNSGGWMHHSYSDPHNTAAKFPKVEAARLRMKLATQTLKSKLRPLKAHFEASTH